MKKTFLSVVITVSLLLSMFIVGCSGSSVSGKVVTEEKEVSNFTTLDIGSAFEVTVTKSDTYGVTIQADESLIEYIEVTQTGNHLKIYLSPRHIFTDFTLGDRKLRAEITMPYLFGLEISGASKGEVTGFSSTSNLNLVVSGASSLKVNNIAAGMIQCEVSGASRISGNLTGTDAGFTVSGASTAELSGSANTLVINVSGASRADLEAYPVNVVDSVVSGASEAVLYVHQMLNVNVSGASRLYFVGNPTLGNTNVSGASTIKHKD